MTSAVEGGGAERQPARLIWRDAGQGLGWAAWSLIGLFVCAYLPVDVLGTKYTAAPFFSLLAWRRWGVAAALATTALLCVPSVALHYDGNRAIMVVGVVIAAMIGRRWDRLMSESVWLAILAMIALRMGLASLDLARLPLPVATLSGLHALLVDTLQALLADLIILNMRLKRQVPWLEWVTTIRLSAALRMMIIFVTCTAFLIALQDEILELRVRAAGLRSVLPAAVAEEAPASAGGELRSLRLPDGNRLTIALARLQQDRQLQTATRLCAQLRVRAGAAAATTPEWLLGMRGCDQVNVRVRGQPHLLVARLNVAGAADARLRSVQLGLMSVALIVVSLFNLWLTTALTRTLAVAKETIRQFGMPGLPPPPPIPFREFQGLLDRFVERNNSYAATIAQRDQLSEAAQTLAQSIGLRLLSDIEVDADKGLLSYTTTTPDGRRLRERSHVHPADRNLLRQAFGAEDALIEVRASEAGDITHLLNLHGSCGPWRWRSGVKVNLRQPRRLRELMLHQARLADLGGMASAICHELKQPLFTIDMAARSIDLLATRGDGVAVQRVSERSHRISEQVARTQEIINRIATYGRVSLDIGGRGEVREAFEAAASFLEPLLHEQAIDVRIEAPAGLQVDVPRVALEQIMVNGIQNAIDAIVQQRRHGHPDAGRISFHAHEADGIVHCQLIDDGIGLPDMAMAEDQADEAPQLFDPFYTTKADRGGSGLGLYIARQIVLEAKGSIALAAAPGGGALLKLSLPVPARA